MNSKVIRTAEELEQHLGDEAGKTWPQIESFFRENRELFDGFENLPQEARDQVVALFRTAIDAHHRERPVKQLDGAPLHEALRVTMKEAQELMADCLDAA